MPDYRLYFVDADGHVRSRLDLVDLASDAEAVQAAELGRDELAAELWQGERVVQKFVRGPKA